MAVVVPSFASVSLPVVGVAGGYSVLDANTSNAQAKTDARGVYNQIMAMGCTTDMTGVELNNRHIVPGVHCINTGTVLNGQMYLNAQNNPNAVFVFKISNRFDVWGNSNVVLMNGARAENVFWQVGGQIIIGPNVQFVGTVVSINSISLNGGAAYSSFDDKGFINGRLWSVGSTVSVSPRAVIGFVQPIVITAPYSQPYQNVQQVTIPASYITVSASDSNFALFVNGLRVNNGERYAFVPGTYIVTEVNMSSGNYGEPTFSDGCAQNGLSGSIILNQGANVTCVITNRPYVGGRGNPGMPNTGFGGSALPILNILGLLIVTAFVWQETSYKRLSS